MFLKQIKVITGKQKLEKEKTSITTFLLYIMFKGNLPKIMEKYKDWLDKDILTETEIEQ